MVARLRRLGRRRRGPHGRQPTHLGRQGRRPARSRAPQLQQAYQRDMAQATRNLPAGPGADAARCAAPSRSQALQQLIAAGGAERRSCSGCGIVVAGRRGAAGGVRDAGVPRPERPVRPADVRGRAAQQRPDRGALPGHDARATWRSGSCWRRCSAGAAAPDAADDALFDVPVREARPPTWWNFRSPPRRAPPAPTEAQLAALVRQPSRPVLAPRNTARSRRSCCRRRRWRRTSRSPTTICRRLLRAAQVPIT